MYSMPMMLILIIKNMFLNILLPFFFTDMKCKIVYTMPCFKTNDWLILHLRISTHMIYVLDIIFRPDRHVNL